MKYYAVKKGRTPGIYNTWSECSDQVTGYKGAEFKKFKTEEEAKNFIIGKEEDVYDVYIEGALVSYVDGSYNIKDKSYSFGAVMIMENDIKKYRKRYKEDEFSPYRNVSGELRGAEFSFKYAIDNNISDLYLHYDYKGIEEWALGNWKTNNPMTKGYKEYYDQISKKLNVVFVKVDAHSGDTYNDMADKLAKEADFKLEEVE